MKCLVLGGGGFIGSALVDRLLQDGHAVRTLVRPKAGDAHTPLEMDSTERIYGDFLNVHDLRAAVRDVDVIFHLVSSTVPKSANDDPVWDAQSNLIGTLQLLQVVKENPVRKIVFASSGGTVYGPPKHPLIDERHPTDPITAYGVTKLAIEKHLRMFSRASEIQTLIMRVANPYGRRQRVDSAQGAVSVFLGRALSGLPIEIWGDGEVVRDYIYIDDVTDAFARSIYYEGNDGVFNVSTGVGTSLNQLLDLIDDALKRQVERIYRPGRPFDASANILDNSLAKRALNWAPTVNVRDGVSRTLSYLREVV